MYILILLLLIIFLIFKENKEYFSITNYCSGREDISKWDIYINDDDVKNQFKCLAHRLTLEGDGEIPMSECNNYYAYQDESNSVLVANVIVLGIYTYINTLI